MRGRLALSLLLTMFACVAAGCVIDQATDERSLGQMLTREDELAIGREEHPRILRQFGGAYGDPALKAYVDKIGQSLAKVSEMPDLAFTFTVLNSPIVNAFALPGGFVYVTRGLLALAGSEAELASVLAHEIGHVTARHAAQRHQRLASLAGSAAAPVTHGEAAPAPAASGTPDATGPDTTAYVRGYTREQEMEADTLGIRYLARAGYEPAAMAGFLTKLDANAKLEAQLMGLPADQADQMNIMSTHPRTADRVRQAAQRAGEVAAPEGAKNRTVGVEAYLSHIDGILYGDDPEQGFVRGTVFLHPKLRFRFEVPTGFRLFNASQRVIARDAQEALILFDSAVRPPDSPAGMGIADYLSKVWSRELALTDIEQITINTFPAATGWTRVDTNRGPRDLRLVAIQFDAETIYRFTFITPPALTQGLAFDLRRTTYSFRALPAAEAAQLKPLRLHVVRAGEADTVATMAARLPLTDNREARFRVLNGLGPDEMIKPDQPLKLFEE